MRYKLSVLSANKANNFYLIDSSRGRRRIYDHMEQKKCFNPCHNSNYFSNYYCISALFKPQSKRESRKQKRG